MLTKRSKIFIAGHRGLVGSSLFKVLKDKGYKNIITSSKKKLDLRNTKSVDIFFRKKKIDYVINCAAKVGGILENKTYPTEFFIDNSLIQINLLKTSHENKVKRVVLLGSSCIYPKVTKTPIKETALLSGKLEETNKSYAISKIGATILGESLFNQYKRDIVCLMPTNVYGINDNFNEKSGHVIPALISKFNAKSKKKITIFGTGKPLREFLYAEDLAEAILLILKTQQNKLIKICDNSFPIINIGSGNNISIKNLAKKICKFSNFKGKVVFDTKYPDGTMKKDLNSKRIRLLGWKPKTSLDIGLKKVINNYKNYK